MKRIIDILIAVITVIVMCVSVTAMSAASSEELTSVISAQAPDTGERLFYEEFTEYFNALPNSIFKTIDRYDELYYHKDSEGEIDWVLIDARCGPAEMIEVLGIVGNRALIMGSLIPFECGMALYDVKAGEFYDLVGFDGYDKYDGLLSAVDKYGRGILIGDMDDDNELSILDATLIQRCLAGICEYSEYDSLEYFTTVYSVWNIDPSFEQLKYFSDFSRNGERDILDATSIQRYLAGFAVYR